MLQLFVRASCAVGNVPCQDTDTGSNELPVWAGIVALVLVVAIIGLAVTFSRRDR